MTPLIDDGDFVLHVGDALETLRGMPAESVHCCVTSPPYWGLRDYGTGSWEGGDDGCDHVRKTHRVQSEDRPRGWDGAFRNTGEPLPVAYGDVCGKCGARRVDHQLGLEPTPDCGKRGLFRLRSDLTVEQREFVARRLAGVESPDA